MSGTVGTNMDSDLEGIIAELLILVGRKPLRGEDKARFKELVRTLRKRNFSNPQISKLTGGALTETHIKAAYTRGVHVEDTSAKDRAIDLLVELVSRGRSLDDVEEYLPVQADLDDRGVDLDSVATLIQLAENSKVPLPEVVQQPDRLRQAGLTLEKVSEVLTHKSELQKIGFTLESIGSIGEAAKALGSPAKIIEAINTFGGISRLVSDEAKLKKAVAQRISHRDDLVRETKGLQENLDQLKGILSLVNRLKEIGYDEEVLTQLAANSENLGGVKSVMDALGMYSKLSVLDNEIQKTSEKLAGYVAKLKQTQADHEHLLPVIGIIQTLVYKKGFSAESIKELLRLAESYGDPFEVFSAVSSYGDIKRIHGQVMELKRAKAVIEGEKQELVAEVAGLRGTTDKVIEEFVSVSKYLTADVRKSINLIATEYRAFAEQLGKQKAEAENLGNELKIARVISAARMFPSEFRDLPMEYLMHMLIGIRRICILKAFNPKIGLMQLLAKNENVFKEQQVELIDVLQLAENGLERGLAGA